MGWDGLVAPRNALAKHKGAGWTPAPHFDKLGLRGGKSAGGRCTAAVGWRGSNPPKWAGGIAAATSDQPSAATYSMPRGRLGHDARPVRTFQKRSGSTRNRGSLVVRIRLAIVGIPHPWRLRSTRGCPRLILRTGVRFPSHSSPAGPARTPAP